MREEEVEEKVEEEVEEEVEDVDRKRRSIIRSDGRKD